jgi:hypothetical protein
MSEQEILAEYPTFKWRTFECIGFATASAQKQQ